MVGAWGWGERNEPNAELGEVLQLFKSCDNGQSKNVSKPQRHAKVPKMFVPRSFVVVYFFGLRCGGAGRGCGGSVVERQATYPVVPSSIPGQSLQYQKISWVL